MKLLLLNTPMGLKPMYDADYEEKKKLKVGEVYKASITLVRNIAFHRRYFALINCAWEYQNEKRREFFHNSVEVFRKTVEIEAGHCDKVYSISRKEWLEVPKSISFDKVDEAEFRDIYERVKDVLFNVFLTHITPEEFNKNLIDF